MRRNQKKIRDACKKDGLLAAAPDLLEACEAFIAAAPSPDNPIEDYDEDLLSRMADMRKAAEMIRKAVAKAKGKR